MKVTVFLVASFFGLFMMSCDKDNTTPQDLTEFDDVVLSAARYSAEADSTTQLKCKGRLTEIATADIPAAITAYLTANYADATVKYAGKDEAGKVVVGLSLADGTHKGLLFNSDGTFKEELTRYKKHAKLTKVEVADLPATITAYVVANFEGAEIKHAGTNEEGEVFVMVLVDSKSVVLLFDADGAFVKQLEKPTMKRGKKMGPGKK